MNIWVTLAGVFALSTTIGHFTMGSKEYLKPMLEADFNIVSKKVMHSVFHYVSVFLILSAIALIGVGTGILSFEGSALLVRFIALNYAAFAVWQIGIAVTSGIPKGIFKMFQWVFFVLIAAFAFLGAGSL